MKLYDTGSLCHFAMKTIKRQVLIDPRGGAEGIRTLDPLNAIEVLSQLSYSPVKVQYTRGLRTAQARNAYATT
jgi:hypothetical protein